MRVGECIVDATTSRASARWMCRPSRHGTRVLSGASARSESGRVCMCACVSRKINYLLVWATLQRSAAFANELAPDACHKATRAGHVGNWTDSEPRRPPCRYLRGAYLRSYNIPAYPPTYLPIYAVCMLAFARSSDCIWRVREYYPLCDKICSYI